MFSDHKPELNALSAIFQLTHYDQVDLCTAIEGLIRGGFQLAKINPARFVPGTLGRGDPDAVEQKSWALWSFKISRVGTKVMLKDQNAIFIPMSVRGPRLDAEFLPAIAYPAPCAA